MTERQLEVCHAIQGGARSLHAVAQSVDPPVSRRTARHHVTAIAESLPDDFEPDAPPFWRVVMWATKE